MEMGVVRDCAHARHTDRFLPPCAVPCRAEPCGTVAITEPGSDQFGSIVGRSHVNFHRTVAAYVDTPSLARCLHPTSTIMYI